MGLIANNISANVTTDLNVCTSTSFALTLHSGTGHTVLDLAGTGNIAIAMGITPNVWGWAKRNFYWK